MSVTRNLPVYRRSRLGQHDYLPDHTYVVVQHTLVVVSSRRHEFEPKMDSDHFFLLDLPCFCLFCASFSGNLVTVGGFNLPRS